MAFQRSETQSEISGLDLFIAAKGNKYFKKIRGLMLEYDLWEIDRIPNKYIRELEKSCKTTIDEIVLAKKHH